MALMELNVLVKSITSVAAAVAVMWAGVTTLDTRYEMKQVHQKDHIIINTGMDNFSYTILKREIREIREMMVEFAENPEVYARLALDLQDAVDRLCNQFPEDRECQ